MEKLCIHETKDSPSVLLDPKTNEFSIAGVCHPENVTKFYDPIISWIEQYKIELSKTKSTKPLEFKIFSALNDTSGPPKIILVSGNADLRSPAIFKTYSILKI